MECLMTQPSLIGQGWWSIVTRPSPMPRSRSSERLRSTERSPPNCRPVLIVEGEGHAFPAGRRKRPLPRGADERTCS
jgi:hypothetical protein